MYKAPVSESPSHENKNTRYNKMADFSLDGNLLALRMGMVFHSYNPQVGGSKIKSSLFYRGRPCPPKKIKYIKMHSMMMISHCKAYEYI